MVYQITSSINWFSEKNVPSKEDEKALIYNILCEMPKNVNSLKFTDNFNCFSDEELLKQAEIVDKKVKHVFFHLTFAINIHAFNYAKTFFEYHFFKNPDYKTNEKEWVNLFSKIENCIKKAIQDISACRNPIIAGYIVESGIPQFIIDKITQIKSINLGNEILESKNSMEYVELLACKALYQIPNIERMIANNAKIIDKIETQGIENKICDEELSEPLVNFIFDKVLKIQLSEIKAICKSQGTDIDPYIKNNPFLKSLSEN